MHRLARLIPAVLLLSLIVAVVALPVNAQYGGGGGGGGGGFTPFSPLPTFPPPTPSPTPTSTVTPTPTPTSTATSSPPPGSAGTSGVVTGPLQVSSSAVFPGDVITVAGDGYAPDVDVTVILGAFSVTLGSLRSNANGSIAGPMVIPLDTIPGEYLLRAEGLNADRVNMRRLTANITVLSRTGSTGAGGGSGGSGARVGAGGRSRPGVSRRGGTIARTGIDALPWLIGALAAIVAGAAMVIVARRRRLRRS